MKAMRPAVINILNDETYMNVLKHYGRLLELRKLARKMSLLATSEDCEVCTTNEGQIMLFAPSAFEFRLIDCSFFGLIEEILRNDRIAKMFSENPFVGDFVVKAK